MTVIKAKKQLTCFDVANYFLSLVDEDCGDSISNLKLQKLVYYAQGYSLAIKDKPLFNENIEAWSYGPVIPELYHHYKEFGQGAIPKPKQIDMSIYSRDDIKLLNEIYAVFGQYSAWKLSSIAHAEKPWIDASTRIDKTITYKALRSFFKTQLEN